MATTADRSWLGSFIQAGRTLLHGVGHLLYPKACHACRAALPPDAGGLCPLCREALANDPLPGCPRCAGNVGPYVNLDQGCAACRDERLAFAEAVRLGPYYDPLSKEVSEVGKAVLRMKGSGGEALAEVAGELFAAERGDRLAGLRAEVVVPVPLHWRKRFQRGYNQSEALARAMAAALRIPCKPPWLRKVRATPPQHHQPSAAARAANVRGAFAAKASAFNGKTVLLVDDVMTTGSTASEAARTLRRAGAARVVVAVLARA